MYRLILDAMHQKAVTIPLAVFFAKMLLLHGLFAVILWLETIALLYLFKPLLKHIEWLVGFLWLINLLWILTANSVFYPYSLFSIYFNPTFSSILFDLTSIIIGSILVLSFIALILNIYQTKKHVKLFYGSVVLLGISTGGFFHHSKNTQPNLSQDNLKPNIIIIGIDALRPDYVTEKNMPALTHFFSKATVFNQSITPISFTFPAWYSILTGEYPKHTGIRFNFNLVNTNHLNQNLAAILLRHHYETIYSTDFRDFDGIDHDFGFKHIIMKGGFYTMLIAYYHELPFVNLLANVSFFGYYLFPSISGNRHMYASYYPSTYINVLYQHLKKIQNRPVFLCVHFCLPHYPYKWAKQEPSRLTIQESYQLALNKMDQQLTAYLEKLNQLKLLNNAIVIVLSDHGESLYLHGDRAISRKTYVGKKPLIQDTIKALNAMPNQDRLDVSIFHGNDVLSFSQYHNVLAFRCYGKACHNQAYKNTQRVSLVDIKKTLLDLLNIKDNSQNDGMSLAKFIQKPPKLSIKPKASNARLIFVESTFFPNSLRCQDVHIKQVLHDYNNAFIIKKNGEVVFNTKSYDKFLKLKQRGIYYKDWILAAYPSLKGGFIYVLVNRKTHQWTIDLNDDFAKQSPAPFLLSQLKQFFSPELL